MCINDDLGMFNQVPTELAQLASNTEYNIVTDAFASAAAWAAWAAWYPGTQALSISALATGIEAMLARTDPAGAPIFCMPKYLVVPPALKLTADRLLVSATLDYEMAGTAGAVTGPWSFGTTNVIRGMLQVVVNPWLQVAGVAQNGTTAWYLFADPATGAGIEAGYLQGHERPELWMRSSDAVKVGGGPVGPFEGSFLDDDIVYRIRDVFAAARRDGRFVYASNGTTAPAAEY